MLLFVFVIITQMQATSSLNILVMGVNHPVPTFIRRRLSKLDAAGVKLIVTCHHKNDFHDFKNAELILVKKITWRKPLQVVVQFFYFLTQFPHNLKLWKLLSGFDFKSRLKRSLEVIDLVRIPNIDLIHLMWMVPEERYLWLEPFYPCVPIVVSIRGSQVTVGAFGKDRSSFISKNFDSATVIHCVSHDIASVCLKLGADPNKLFVNYNGIDSRKFQPGAIKTVNNFFKIISVGSLIWRKGYNFQLQIVHSLVALGYPVHLTIVGSGVDEKELCYTASRMGLSKHVLFTGQLSEIEIINLLQTSDLYLSTSVAEGLPNSLVEAASCGLPIVSFDCEGVNEIVENNETGYVVAFGDVKLAVEKIIHLIENENYRLSMKEKARQKIEIGFNEDFWVQEMLKRYNNLSKHIGTS